MESTLTSETLQVNGGRAHNIDVTTHVHRCVCCIATLPGASAIGTVRCHHAHATLLRHSRVHCPLPDHVHHSCSTHAAQLKQKHYVVPNQLHYFESQETPTVRSDLAHELQWHHQGPQFSRKLPVVDSATTICRPRSFFGQFSSDSEKENLDPINCHIDAGNNRSPVCLKPSIIHQCMANSANSKSCHKSQDLCL